MTLFDSLSTLFFGVDTLPWCDSEDVFKWECKLLAASSDDQKTVIRRRLLWALVHSEWPEDVQCGITILQGSLLSPSNLKQNKKVMYRLAVGYYRSGDYSKSMDLVDGCLEIAPDSCSAVILKNVIRRTVMKGAVNGICTAALMSVHVVSGFLRVCSFVSIDIPKQLFAIIFTQYNCKMWSLQAITFKKSIEDRVEKDSLFTNSNPLQMKEEMFLLAHRYYIRGEYSRSRHLADYCLKIAPEWRPSITLKKTIEASIKYNEVMGIGIGVTAVVVGIVVGTVYFCKN